MVKVQVPDSGDVIYYQPEDLYIGGRMKIHKHCFILIDADEYALRYMENHSAQVSEPTLNPCYVTILIFSVSSSQHFTHSVKAEGPGIKLLHKNQGCLYKC